MAMQKPADVSRHLLPCLLHGAILKLKEEGGRRRFMSASRQGCKAPVASHWTIILPIVCQRIKASNLAEWRAALALNNECVWVSLADVTTVMRVKSGDVSRPREGGLGLSEQLQLLDGGESNNNNYNETGCLTKGSVSEMWKKTKQKKQLFCQQLWFLSYFSPNPFYRK